MSITYHKNKYLIIGGVTKAATTSLFKYLSDHPEICASTMKETGYFLDRDYPNLAKCRFEDDHEKYACYFNHCSADKLRMEATPDYLYSSGTAYKIRRTLPNVKMIFSLREPISRLVSWHRFAMHDGRLSETISFDEYVRIQFGHQGRPSEMQWMRALEQGRYSRYLKNYIDIFGHNNICIVFHEELVTDPCAVMYQICQHAKIDPHYYDDYQFKRFHRTYSMRFPNVHGAYNRFKTFVRLRTHRFPFLHSLLKSPKYLIEPLYLMLNRRRNEVPNISSETAQLLKQYYGEEKAQIESIIARPVPWP